MIKNKQKKHEVVGKYPQAITVNSLIIKKKWYIWYKYLRIHIIFQWHTSSEVLFSGCTSISVVSNSKRSSSRCSRHANTSVWTIWLLRLMTANKVREDNVDWFIYNVLYEQLRCYAYQFFWSPVLSRIFRNIYYMFPILFVSPWEKKENNVWVVLFSELLFQLSIGNNHNLLMADPPLMLHSAL